MRTCSLPYVNKLSEVTARMLLQLNIKLVHQPSSTLRRLLTTRRPPTERMKRSNVVYRIDCSLCDQFYVGQTMRALGVRVAEHKAAVRRRDPHSQIWLHTDETGHSFNFENTRVIGTASNRHAREFLESWNSTPQSINRKVDIDPTYEPLRARLLESRRKRPPDRTTHSS